MQIGNFNVDLEKNKIYSSLELAATIFSAKGGLIFLELCKDFNPFGWNMIQVYGRFYEENNNVYIRLDSECINELILEKDECMSEDDVYEFVMDIQSEPIDTINENNKIFLDENNLKNIDTYIIFRSEHIQILSLYAKTDKERLLNFVSVYANLFDHCNIKTSKALLTFVEVIRNEYKKEFCTNDDPFCIEFGTVVDFKGYKENNKAKIIEFDKNKK